MRFWTKIVTAVLMFNGWWTTSAFAVDYHPPQIDASPAPIFQSEASLESRLEAPFQELFAHKADGFFKQKEAKVAGRLIEAGHEIQVEIRMRGYSSLGACSFPKLTLKIDRASAAGTSFAGLDKIDLGTHCGTVSSENQDFSSSMKMNHREALLYRWLQILGIPSYASRPAMITYKDTSKGADASDDREQAFWLENLESFLQRAHAIEIRAVRDSLHPDAGDANKHFKKLYTDFEDSAALDRLELARISLFNAFVGNGDYRLEPDEIWNLKLIDRGDGVWLPIPIDFNFSNLVMAVTPGSLQPTESFFAPALADGKFKLQILNEWLAARSRLEDSVNSLAGDAEGMRVFRETLDAQFARIETLKNGISQGSNP